MKQQLTRLLAVLGRYRVLIGVVLGSIVLAPVLLILAAYLIIQPSSNYILSDRDSQTAKVGLVLGAGVDSRGKPFKELRARLDVAARELQAGRVEKLILSGDNRFHRYNEPAAMVNYLVEEKHIPASKLQPDYAGRSTYESCERAAKIFGLKKTVIFSAESHLPRAIFLCRHFGIEAYGVPSFLEANNSTRREALARVKALLNAYVRGEPTILGKPIKIK